MTKFICIRAIFICVTKCKQDPKASPVFDPAEAEYACRFSERELRMKKEHELELSKKDEKIEELGKVIEELKVALSRQGAEMQAKDDEIQEHLQTIRELKISLRNSYCSSGYWSRTTSFGQMSIDSLSDAQLNQELSRHVSGPSVDKSVTLVPLNGEGKRGGLEKARSYGCPDADDDDPNLLDD